MDHLKRVEIADRLFMQYPKSRGIITRRQPVYEGLSSATVWLVDINSTSDGYPNGFAFAKVDTVARCRKELERHAKARAHRMIRDYIPEIIYPEYSTGFTDEEWGFVVYQPAHNIRRSSSLAGLIRKPENQQRSALIEQISKLLDEVVSHWYLNLSNHKREIIDIATIFKVAFNIGDEDLPPNQQRLATLKDRANEYFGLFGDPKILEIPIDGGLSLPNPISLIMNLKDGECCVSGYLVPAHGDMHCGNIICRQEGFGGRLENVSPWLIDFAQFNDEMLPFYDLATVEFDILARLLPTDTASQLRDWHNILHHIFSGEICPKEDPPGISLTSTAWDLIKPIRKFIASVISKIGNNAIGIDNEMHALWLVASVCIGLQVSRRSKISHGLRSMGLVYAAMAMRQLLKALEINCEGEKMVLHWQDGKGLTATAPAIERVSEIQNQVSINPYNYLPIPRPPNVYFAHRYHYGRQPFFGRTDVLYMLNKWFQGNGEKTLVLEAIGGQGKTALAWYWFNTYAIEQPLGFSGGIWWSFYSDDGRLMDNFITHALAYLTKENHNAFENMQRSTRERLLISLLSGNEPYLIVMDGIERILLAYRTEKASHLSEKNLHETIEDAAQRDRNLRFCSNPDDGQFLQELTQVLGKSKLLITTRLLIGELQDRASRPMPHIRCEKLDGLASIDVLEIMNYYGVKGEANDILELTNQFDNHGLLVSVIAARIARQPGAAGEFQAWYETEGSRLNLHKLNLMQQQNMVLMHALNGLPDEPTQVLKQLSAFRFPITHKLLTIANPLAEKYQFQLAEAYQHQKGSLQNGLKNLGDLNKLRERAVQMQKRLRDQTIVDESSDASRSTSVLLTGAQEAKYVKLSGKDRPELIPLINNVISKSQVLAAKELMKMTSETCFFDMSQMEKFQAQALKMQESLAKQSTEEIDNSGNKIVMTGDQRILELSIDGQPYGEFVGILNRAIRRSQEMAADALMEFSSFEEPSEELEEARHQAIPDLNKALSELTDRGLIQIDFELDSYDLHPIVRAYVYEEMSKDEKISSQARKRRAFEETEPVDVGKVKTISDIQREMEIYHSYLETDDSDQALFFFATRLSPILVARLGHYSEASKLIEPLLQNIDGLIERLPVEMQISILFATTSALRSSKRPEEKHQNELAVDKALKSGNRKILFYAIRKLSIYYLDNDEIFRSIRTDQLNLRLAEGLKYRYGIVETYLALFLRYIEIGQWEKADAYHQKIVKVIPTLEPAIGDDLISTYQQYNAYRALYRGEEEPPYLTQLELQPPSDFGAHGEQQVLHLRGEFALQRGEYDIAIHYFNRLLDYKQETLEDIDEPLGCLARAHLAKGDTKLAREFTENGADELSTAKIWLALGEKIRAKDAAVKAYEKGWADGPPYAYLYKLVKAKEIFEKLGEPLPDLAPFDEERASAEPLYREAEILAVIETLTTDSQDAIDSD